MRKQVLLAAILSVMISFALSAQTITRFAGTVKQLHYAGDNGAAVQARLDPFFMAFDASGNMYVTDGYNFRIRKIDAAGIITTFAGNGIEGHSGDGGPATAAAIRCDGIACDAQGNVYISNWEGWIRKVDRAGIITTIAGNGIPGYTGDGGPAVNAQVCPSYLTVDQQGNLYFSDIHDRIIRKINTAGIITTVAGSGGQTILPGTDDNIPVRNCAIAPMGLVVDNTGNLYFACASNRIRKVNTSGIVTTIAGDGLNRYSGDGVPAVTTSLAHCTDLALDADGNVYIADHFNHRIRKVNTAGIITTIAGNGTLGYAGDNGPAVNAVISYPMGIKTGGDGNIYFSDVENYVVRKIEVCKTPPVATVTINAIVTAACAGTPVSFIATPVNGGNTPIYQWQINGSNEGAGEAVFTTNKLQPGDVVSCTMTSSLACAEPVTSNRLTIEVNPAPGISLEDEITILPGSGTALQPVVTGTVTSYLWSPATALSDPALQTLYASPMNTTTYQVDVVSDKGCTASKKITVVVYRKIRMPNAFTPNTDRKNDVFRIPVGTTFELKDFAVYNRWGGIVFRTKDINRGWDGTINNLPAPAGSYVYSITGTDQHKKVVVKGVVLLLR